MIASPLYRELPEKYDLFLFDLDGTLIDSAPDLVGALNEVLISHGLSEAPYEKMKPHAGIGSRALLQHGYAHHSRAISAEKLEASVPEFLAAYEKRIFAATSAFDGAGAYLRFLKEKNKKIALTTNKPEKFTRMILEYLQWGEFFDGVFCPENVTKRKPEPEHLLEPIAFFNLSREKTVLFGDSVTDFNAAKAAKVDLMMADLGYSDLTPFRHAIIGSFERYAR